ncbi:hypothetical protein PHYSODRAFT_503141 [Phytophthora sojae]|uniref:Uncharacterized protein n=1 Tax=Phytophthora sojae (strain P6497) TaxID=1094619 RepID=G4ZCT8_PHYSP|nr:hypothetical protein PHYSODRAFT_503141 [Phytophthora sojae]EGZ18296.1 hypothetical protein PHYSODRAFT_503141 [Phytophthora sojae]|eukprot:XP_009527354.1 hypothetical protein PHYSODRAFT_503141 [Phytophthora sojae]
MDAQTQLPTFTLAVYVGVLAIIVVLAVAFTMLRIYAYRNRLSTVTISASYDADAELADANSNALIATTLSALGSPLPDFPDEPPVTSKTSMLSSFGSSRWEQVRSFVAGIRSRGTTAWSSLRQRFASRRASKTSNRKTDYRGSQPDVDIVTPCDNHLKLPFQLSLFRSPASDDVGMI